MQSRLKQIDPVYAACGLTLLLLIPFKGPELLKSINDQSTLVKSAQMAAKNNAAVSQIFSQGCITTGYLVDSGTGTYTTNLVKGRVAYFVDPNTKALTPATESAVLCDRMGNAGKVGQGGVIEWVGSSAKVRDTIIKQGLAK